MVIVFSFPVDFSRAETLRIPLASMSKVTSIWGCPRGMGGIPSKMKFPSKYEVFEQVVVLGLGALSREDLNQHTVLVISVGGESLGLLGRDGGITLDERGHDTTTVASI
jgi:hypothetical protein